MKNLFYKTGGKWVLELPSSSISQLDQAAARLHAGHAIKFEPIGGWVELEQ